MAAPKGNRHNAKWNNETLLARVCIFILQGCSKTDAFKRVGVHPDTAFGWLRLARAEPDTHPLLVKFERVLERAVAHYNSQQIKVINNAAMSGAPNTWQAAAWQLERRDPENWGRRDKTVIESGDKPLIQLNQVVLVDEGARSAARALLERVASPGAYESLGTGVRGELEVESGTGGVPVEVDPRETR